MHSVAAGDVGGDVPVTAVLRGRRYALVDHETVLESALRQEVPVPYSCTMGGCGACRMKLVEGAIALENCNCLTAEERSEGYVLAKGGRRRRACLSQPLMSAESDDRRTSPIG